MLLRVYIYLFTRLSFQLNYFIVKQNSALYRGFKLAISTFVLSTLDPKDHLFGLQPFPKGIT